MESSPAGRVATSRGAVPRYQIMLLPAHPRQPCTVDFEMPHRAHYNSQPRNRKKTFIIEPTPCLLLPPARASEEYSGSTQSLTQSQRDATNLPGVDDHLLIRLGLDDRKARASLGVDQNQAPAVALNLEHGLDSLECGVAETRQQCAQECGQVGHCGSLVLEVVELGIWCSRGHLKWVLAEVIA